MEEFDNGNLSKNQLKKNHKTLKRLSLVLLVIFLMWLSFGAGIYLVGRNRIVDELVEKETVFLGKLLGKYSEAEPGKLTQDVDFDLFWDVWDMIQESYVDKEKLNEKKLFYGALRGLVQAVGDPYTVFMDPKISKEFEEDLSGTFEGIGAEIGMKNDILTIIAPLPEMPAQLAGLKAGDKVLAIDSESTMGITIDEAVNRIRGERGTEVTLSIAREGVEGLKDIIITRDKIVVASVRTNLRDDNIYVIEITNFNTDTEDRFNKAVREVIDTNPRGIILDLRNNPGGFLDTAIELASEWVENDIVVVEKYTDDMKFEHLARGRARLKIFPTVVLVNQGSASASEIVSGALQDYGLAIIVGEQTFGKGSVQTLNNLQDGSSLKITVAKWLTPSGRSINDDGIMPNIELELTLEDYEADRDPQFDKAVEILSGESIVKEEIGEEGENLN